MAEGNGQDEIPVLAVDELSVAFGSRGGLLGRTVQRRVVRDVSFAVRPGEAVALVGESGSGKTTAARAALRLLPADAGRIWINGADVTDVSPRKMRAHRRHVQMIFQDPFSSLDPSMTAAELIGEAFLGLQVDEASRRPLAELLGSVGLGASAAGRYPHEFSGGQRQRLAIARALAPSPDLLVCDEPVSALDLSTQNQILALLDRLRDKFNLALLFISHDLSLVRWLADRIFVMYCGEIVEHGPTEELFSNPKHPYTYSLLSAIPSIGSADSSRSDSRVVLEGDIPSPFHPPYGCPFHTRCPVALDECSLEKPLLRQINAGGRASCHLHEKGPQLNGAGVGNYVREKLSSPSSS